MLCFKELWESSVLVVKKLLRQPVLYVWKVLELRTFYALISTGPCGSLSQAEGETVLLREQTTSAALMIEKDAA